MKQLTIVFILITCFSFVPVRHIEKENYGPIFPGTWNISMINYADGKTMITTTMTVKADGTYGLDGLNVFPGKSDWVMYGTCSDGYSWRGNFSNTDGSAKGTFNLRATSSNAFSGTYIKSGTTTAYVWSGTRP